jgi:hypothetical protein
VRPYCNFDPTPSQVDVGVMSLLFGELAYLIDEIQSLWEVLEPEVAAQVVFLDDLPFGDLLPEGVELLSLEGRNTTLAWYARLAGQFGHSLPPVKMNLLRIGF